MGSSEIVLIDRRLNTPGKLVVKRSEGLPSQTLKLFFKKEKEDPAANDHPPVKVRVTQERTGNSVTLGVMDTFQFTLDANDALWVASSQDVVCWAVF